MNNIQTEATTDAGGGQDVGYIDAGSWMDYKVNVQTAGAYTVQFRVASEAGGGTFQLKKGDTVLVPTTTAPVTGGWQNWVTVTANVTLAAGEQTLRFQALSAGFNLNWMQFATGATDPGGDPGEDPGEDTTGAPIGQTIWLRGFNNQYVSSKNGVGPMWCNATAVGGWNQFLVQDAGNGKITLSNQGKYVSSENGEQAMTCTRDIPQEWEQFEWIKNADGTISLKGNNGMFVSSENGEQAMNCDRPEAQGWEAFNWGVVGAARKAAVAPVQDTKAEALQISVYPNPLSTNATVNFSTKEAGHVSLSLYNNRGEQVQVLLNANVAAGSHTQSFTPATLPTGMYVLKMIYNGKTITRKLIKQ